MKKETQTVDNKNNEEKTIKESKIKSKKKFIACVVATFIIIFGIIGFILYKNTSFFKNKNNKSYSNNCSLKWIEIEAEGYETITFSNFEENELSAKFPYDVTQVNIIVTPADRKAKITGDGKTKIEYGQNYITINVEAENGNTKSYKLLIYRSAYQSPVYEPEPKPEPNKKIDISSINISKDLPSSTSKPELLEILKETNKLTYIDHSEEIGYTFKNKKLKFKIDLPDEEETEFEINNIDSAFYYYEDTCSGDITLFMISGNNVYLIRDLDSVGKFNFDEDVTVYKNKSYSEIYSIVVHSATCGLYLNYLGKSSDGNYYHIEDASKTDVNTKYNYFDILKSNRELTVGGKTYNVKVVVKGDVNDDLRYIIDSNNILYSLNSEYEKNVWSIKKVSDKKVKTINLYDESLVSIELEDGTMLDDDEIFGYIEY